MAAELNNHLDSRIFQNTSEMISLLRQVEKEFDIKTIYMYIKGFYLFHILIDYNVF